MTPMYVQGFTLKFCKQKQIFVENVRKKCVPKRLNDGKFYKYLNNVLNSGKCDQI